MTGLYTVLVLNDDHEPLNLLIAVHAKNEAEALQRAQTRLIQHIKDEQWFSDLNDQDEYNNVITDYVEMCNLHVIVGGFQTLTA